MKVLEVIDKSFVGGGQANVRNLLEGFLDTEVEAQLACRDGGPLVEKARALGTMVHPVAFDKRFRPGPARAVARIVREQGIELLHSHGLVATFYCTLARRFFGIDVPLVYHQHGFHHRNYGPATVKLRKRAERWVCRQADIVVASSDSDRQLLLDGGYAASEQVVVLHNGIPEPVPTTEELAKAEELFSILDRDSEAPVVGVIARLHIQKGIDTFLRAAVQIREAVPATRFVIVGTGEIEDECHELGRELSLADDLIWTGTLPSKAVAQRFSVAVMASRWEGLPIVLLEYMAQGLPIVTTDLNVCLEVLGEGTAETVPVDDAAALADAVIGLLRDRERAAQLGRVARQRYERAFTLEAIARDTVEVFRGLLG